MTTATVVWYDPVRGMGFLKPSGEAKDIFVHRTALERAGLATLEKGQAVEFTPSEGHNGRLSAVDLRLL